HLHRDKRIQRVGRDVVVDGVAAGSRIHRGVGHRRVVVSGLVRYASRSEGAGHRHGGAGNRFCQSRSHMTPEKIAVPGAEAMLYRDAPTWDRLKCAAIGSIRFDSAEAGRELLSNATASLKAEGFTALLGPMDGDTWHSYR